MGEVSEQLSRFIEPFNGPVEIGLRALVVLNEAFPTAYSLQRLINFDYLLVHSDDIPNGPQGLHPQTPRRSGELLVRRNAVKKGLLLYQSRSLLTECYKPGGVYFSATERSASFLDVLNTEYVRQLRERAEWVVATFGTTEDVELESTIRQHVGKWGAEFAMESVLWAEGSE